jgi:hypothetical protein
VCALFEGDFYVDRDAVRAAIGERGMFNLIHQAYVIKVDCIVRKDGEYRRAEFERRRHGTVEAHDLAFVAPEDLIISKLDAVSDTPPEVMRRYQAMLLARSSADRLKMGCSMSATPRALVRASVLARDPHASPAALRPVPALLRQRVRRGGAREDSGPPWAGRAHHGPLSRQRPIRRRRDRTKSTTTYSPSRSGAAMKARPWLMRAMSSTKPTR